MTSKFDISYLSYQFEAIRKFELSWIEVTRAISYWITLTKREELFKKNFEKFERIINWIVAKCKYNVNRGAFKQAKYIEKERRDEKRTKIKILPKIS